MPLRVVAVAAGSVVAGQAASHLQFRREEEGGDGGDGDGDGGRGASVDEEGARTDLGGSEGGSAGPAAEAPSVPPVASVATLASAASSSVIDGEFHPPPASWLEFEEGADGGGGETEEEEEKEEEGKGAIPISGPAISSVEELAAHDSSLEQSHGPSGAGSASALHPPDAEDGGGSPEGPPHTEQQQQQEKGEEEGQTEGHPEEGASPLARQEAGPSALRSIQSTGTALAASTAFHVTTTLPLAAGELVTSSLRRAVHSARLVYSNRTWVGKNRLYSDLGGGIGGYHRDGLVWDAGGDLRREGGAGGAGVGRKPVGPGLRTSGGEDAGDLDHVALPPFSSLPWVDRQLVKEWRTYDLSNLGEASPSSAMERVAEERGVDAAPSHGDGVASGTGEDQLVDHQDDDPDYATARTVVPAPLSRPPRENASTCHYCDRPFGATRHRHHCRLCGRSCCQTHSSATHLLPHLGYDASVAERVCFRCKAALEERNLAERIAWRLARTRDFLRGDLVPYFETGIDTVEDAAVRLTRAAIAMARKIPLGAQATVAVETLEVLRKHGLKGVYGLILRKEFMAAADLLCRVAGINHKVWPLSVHELSAAIFYALTYHRMVRGMDPEGEHRIHTLKGEDHGEFYVGEGLEEEEDERSTIPTWEDIAGVPAGTDLSSLNGSHEEGHIVGEIMRSEEEKSKHLDGGNTVHCTDARSDNKGLERGSQSQNRSQDGFSPGTLFPQEIPSHRRLRPLVPVCEPAPDSLIASFLFYAPLALNFIYASSEVDMQLLAAQQGWRLLYAHLDQSGGCHASSPPSSMESAPAIAESSKGKKMVADRPAFALLVRPDQKMVCLTIRGTSTINDVVTDIRAMPIPFPPEEDTDTANGTNEDVDWTSVSRGKGLALCGMARAAINLYRETIDSLLVLARSGYRIRFVGHSLGGGVAALLGSLVRKRFEVESIFSTSAASTSSLGIDDALRVYGYGTPSCTDTGLADASLSYVFNCILHDDVVPRLTASSVRGLLKHLLYVRETWVKAHLSDDISAYAERAKGAWAPRWRQSFTRIKTTSKKQIRKCKDKYRDYTVTVAGESSSELPHEDGREDIINESGNTASVGEAILGVSEPMELSPAKLVDLGTELVTDFDGDLFFEVEEALIESDIDGEEESSCTKLISGNPVASEVEREEINNEQMKEPVHSALRKSEAYDEDNSGTAVMLEEMPLPRMYIPGNIVHIYTHRGAYKAALVPKAYRELRRISLAGNMLSDHMARQYYEGLLEVKAVRRAREHLPQWTGFAEESTCDCCASRFTWASTSSTEAQEARDKHNCRSCGGLVCDPCSKNRLPLPDFGISLPSRVCDRCYNDLGCISAEGNDPLTASFLSEDTKDYGALKREPTHELESSIRDAKNIAVAI